MFLLTYTFRHREGRKDRSKRPTNRKRTSYWLDFSQGRWGVDVGRRVRHNQLFERTYHICNKNKSCKSKCGGKSKSPTLLWSITLAADSVGPTSIYPCYLDVSQTFSHDLPHSYSLDPHINRARSSKKEPCSTSLCALIVSTYLLPEFMLSKASS